MHEYMTPAELSELIRRPTETLRYWRAQGRGPRALKTGRSVLYARADVADWLNSVRQGATR